MPEKLTNWALLLENDPFKAPEAKQIFLRGIKNNNELVVVPVNVNDFNPETHELGGFVLDNPHPAYMDWLKQNPPERFGYDKPDPLREYAMSFSKGDK